MNGTNYNQDHTKIPLLLPAKGEVYSELLSQKPPVIYLLLKSHNKMTNDFYLFNTNNKATPILIIMI